MNFGSATTPLTDAGPGGLRGVRRLGRRRRPGPARTSSSATSRTSTATGCRSSTPTAATPPRPRTRACSRQTYDALKAVARPSTVIGGAVSPRGSDNPGTGQDTHSPTAFIHDLGAAYRASGRDDADHGRVRVPPVRGRLERRAGDRRAPELDDDRARRLRQARRAARHGVRRHRAGRLDAADLYDEFGVESQIPAAKQALYTGTEPATTKPVAEATQAAYYRQAIQLAFCQPNVAGLFLFHAFDETALAGWQSGLYYADGTPKTSLAPVRAAMRGVAARRRRARARACG